VGIIDGVTLKPGMRNSIGPKILHESKSVITLFLSFKKARRPEVHSVPKREAQGIRRRRTQHGCEAHFYKKNLIVFHISQSIFCKTQVR